MTARGLVVENPRTREIIKFHSSYYKNVSEINFERDVLVYVTPVSTICGQKMVVMGKEDMGNRVE